MRRDRSLDEAEARKKPGEEVIPSRSVEEAEDIGEDGRRLLEKRKRTRTST